jgi:microcystin-dependent protein
MDYFIGSIELFPFTYAPMGWMYCDGTMLSIADYSPLFALIGTNYGGDGINTFALPNLQGTEPIPGTHFLICVEGLFPTQN